MSNQAEAIRAYILKHVPNHPSDIVSLAENHFQVTRTTIHRHLSHLINRKLLLKTGKTRDTRYHLTSDFKRQIRYKITPRLSEFSAFKEEFEDIFKQLPENVFNICIYGFTEIFNNAIDHSQGSQITVATDLVNDRLTITISDDGIGAFRLISDYLQLQDIRESILQLYKGKLTTDPSNHTGEGIFFSSRAFDRFELYANTLRYFRDNHENDWGLETIPKKMTGTTVSMTINRNAPTQLIEIFEKYQDPSDLSFSKTEILVKLAQIGDEPLISRSQAKRIVVGLEKFSHVTLDFSGVRLVGQGFVDEVFRIFANNHPNITIEPINMTPDVNFMIKRSLAGQQ